MSSDNQFAYAVHVLTILLIENRPVSSTEMAEGVRSHPVTIRKAIAALKSAGLVDTISGSSGGAVLTRPAEQINLRQVYEAMGAKPLFDSSGIQPGPSCSLGRNVQKMIAGVFLASEQALLEGLEKMTIASVYAEVQASKNKL